MKRQRWVGAVLLLSLAGAVALLLTRATFLGEGADVAHHHALVYWLAERRAFPGPEESLGEMSFYPPGSHVVAAALGAVAGSTFAGMHAVSILALVALWSAVAGVVLAISGGRRWWALALLGMALLLNSPVGPFRLELHGRELVQNYFFAQLVGQAVFWAAAAWVAHTSVISWRRTFVPVAAAAVIVTWVHVVAAVELVVLLGLMSLFRSRELWSRGERRRGLLSAPVLGALATGAAVLVSPGFVAMRSISTNDGALEVAYFNGMRDYVLLAVLVSSTSLLMVVASERGPRAFRASAVPVRTLGLLGWAIAAPCLAQAVALTGGEGSAYAVKKYAFGLLTVGVVQACVALALLLPAVLVAKPPALRWGSRPAPVPARALWNSLGSWAAAALLSVGAVVSVFEQPALYAPSQVDLLQQRVEALRADADLVAGDVYAARLPEASPAIDYLVSISTLTAPRDDVAAALFDEQPLPLGEGDSAVITAVGSPYDKKVCRRSQESDLVLVDASCLSLSAADCGPAIRFGAAGSVTRKQVEGFARAEAEGRWTNGARAAFTCDLPAGLGGQQVRVRLEGNPFLPDGVARQRLRVRVAGTEKDYVFQPGVAPTAVELAVQAPSSGPLTIVLQTPDAVSPAELGLAANDKRRLGYFVSSISVTPGA